MSALKFVRVLTAAELLERPEHGLAPKGFTWAWHDETAPNHSPAGRWEIGIPAHLHRCRSGQQPPCRRTPVVTLWRRVNRLTSGTMRAPWPVCPQHMYGRKLEDGRIIGPYLAALADIQHEASDA